MGEKRNAGVVSDCEDPEGSTGSPTRCHKKVSRLPVLAPSSSSLPPTHALHLRGKE